MFLKFSQAHQESFALIRMRQYLDWLSDACSGSKYTYYIGLSPQDNYVSSKLAARIYLDYKQGLVYPVSVRTAPHIFKYIAIRSSKKI